MGILFIRSPAAQTPLRKYSPWRLCSSLCWPSAPLLSLRKKWPTRKLMSSSGLPSVTAILTEALPTSPPPPLTSPPPSNTSLPPQPRPREIRRRSARLQLRCLPLHRWCLSLRRRCLPQYLHPFCCHRSHHLRRRSLPLRIQLRLPLRYRRCCREERIDSSIRHNQPPNDYPQNSLQK